MESVQTHRATSTPTASPRIRHFGARKVVSYGCGESESLPQELAAPPSAPVQGADGGIGSESVLQAGASLSAPGGHIDPLTRVDTQQYKRKLNLVLSDSGVPGGPLPDAAAVGEHPTLSAAQRPSTPPPWATSRDFAPEVGQ